MRITHCVNLGRGGAKNILKRLRKQLGAGNKNNAEHINVLEIAERDKWVCGICHDPIDSTALYPDPGYRSLDHILPLSLGGSHTSNNVRITHLHCNVRRGAARDDNILENALEEAA